MMLVMQMHLITNMGCYSCRLGVEGPNDGEIKEKAKGVRSNPVHKQLETNT
jgi:hypothetical protein